MSPTTRWRVVSTQILTPRVVMPSPKSETTTAQGVNKAAGKTIISAARTLNTVT